MENKFVSSKGLKITEDLLSSKRKKRFKLTIGFTGSYKIYYSEIEKNNVILIVDSLYSLLKHFKKENIWKKFKEDLIKKEGNKCWICGGDDKKLNAHEFWRYYPIKNGKGKKKLVAIHHICAKCHAIQHFDNHFVSPERLKIEIKYISEIWHDPSKQDEVKTRLERIIKRIKREKELIQHFCEVNKCSETDFWQHWDGVQQEKERLKNNSYGEWNIVDFGKYKKILKEAFGKSWREFIQRNLDFDIQLV